MPTAPAGQEEPPVESCRTNELGLITADIPAQLRGEPRHMQSNQPSLFEVGQRLPLGFKYQAHLLSAHEEHLLDGTAYGLAASGVRIPRLPGQAAGHLFWLAV